MGLVCFSFYKSVMGCLLVCIGGNNNGLVTIEGEAGKIYRGPFNFPYIFVFLGIIIIFRRLRIYPLRPGPIHTATDNQPFRFSVKNGCRSFLGVGPKYNIFSTGTRTRTHRPWLNLRNESKLKTVCFKGLTLFRMRDWGKTTKMLCLVDSNSHYRPPTGKEWITSLEI